MKKNKRKSSVSETSIPVGVYPELDRDLGRESKRSHVPLAALAGLQSGEAGLPIPTGIYPVLDSDLARDNVENDIPAADLEDLRPDSRKLR